MLQAVHLVLIPTRNPLQEIAGKTVICMQHLSWAKTTPILITHKSLMLFRRELLAQPVQRLLSDQMSSS